MKKRTPNDHRHSVVLQPTPCYRCYAHVLTCLNAKTTQLDQARSRRASRVMLSVPCCTACSEVALRQAPFGSLRQIKVCLCWPTGCLRCHRDNLAVTTSPPFASSSLLTCQHGWQIARMPIDESCPFSFPMSAICSSA